MQRYNRTQGARYLGISRTTLWKWLAGSEQKLFTKRELDVLAAENGHAPLLDRGEMKKELEALRAEVEALKRRMAALEEKQAEDDRAR